MTDTTGGQIAGPERAQAELRDVCTLCPLLWRSSRHPYWLGDNCAMPGPIMLRALVRRRRDGKHRWITKRLPTILGVKFDEGIHGMADKRSIVQAERIHQAIVWVRRQKVMLSPDLAQLYGVESRALIQAVQRNRDRFPPDFMFQLTKAEWANLKSHFVTSSWGGIRRATPYAFTEQGVAMLSSVLKSTRAVRVNIEIMRAFVRLRRVLAANSKLSKRLDAIEKRVGGHDRQIAAVIQAIRELMAPPKQSPRMGFHVRE